MACFTLNWLRDLFIFFIVVGGIYAIIMLLLPIVTQRFPGAGTVIEIVRIALWVVFWCFVVYFAFDLISCLLSFSGGLKLPHAGR